MTVSQFEFRSVSKSYEGHAALTEVSFTLAAGEHTAIVGPSGCGKTTALRLLAGLEMPSGGQVLCNGQVVSEPSRIVRPPHERDVAMVFQDLALWPNLSVLDNVVLGLSGARLSHSEARRQAREALALCGIESLANRKPGRISGGQQQRVSLARAMAVQPAFLLLDEPFSGLDLLTKTRLLQEIAELVERGGVQPRRSQRKPTVVLVTHDPLEATTLCHVAVVLEEGRVTEAGALRELLRDPQSQMLKIFQKHVRDMAPATP